MEVKNSKLEIFPSISFTLMIFLLSTLIDPRKFLFHGKFMFQFVNFQFLIFQTIWSTLEVVTSQYVLTHGLE